MQIRKAINLVSLMYISKYTDQSNNIPDNLNKIRANYSPNRQSRPWPPTLFYNMIAVSLVNSGIIYVTFKETSMMKRFDFIHILAFLQRNKWSADYSSQIFQCPKKNHQGDPERKPVSLASKKNIKSKTCRYCS